jgi:chaperone modulatory protein CbpM
MTYPLVRARRLDLEEFAAAAGMHADLIRRLVAVGVLDPSRDLNGRYWFTPADLAQLGRIQRLRAGFALNYAAVGLVADLLDRIAVLEAALRVARRPGG